MSKKMIGHCGYRCDLCAARSDDPKTRKKLIGLWRRYYGLDMYTVENVRCDGCRGGGRLADKSCRIKPCVIAKGLDNCAECDDFPCEIFMKTAGLNDKKSYLKRLGPVPAEDFEMAMKMFCNKPYMVRMRKKLGKDFKQ